MATPKKKHLIELMIEAGVKWPEGAEYAAQDKQDNWVQFYKGGKPNYPIGFDLWMADNCVYMLNNGIPLPALCRSWHQTIVTREQYEKALADTSVIPATQQETQPNDEWEPVEWGDWSIGDTVRFDEFTNTAHDHWSFKVGTLYVIGKHGAPIAGNGQYPTRNWGFSFSRRKKQNEQHIEAQPSPEYCASVIQQVPDSTIEHLAGEYHARVAEAQRLRAIADVALKQSEDALCKLRKACKVLGLEIFITTAN